MYVVVNFIEFDTDCAFASVVKMVVIVVPLIE